VWSRLRIKTLAPRRPILYPVQYLLAGLTVLALLAGVVIALVAGLG
jgi:hypothetical protein